MKESTSDPAIMAHEASQPAQSGPIAYMKDLYALFAISEEVHRFIKDHSYPLNVKRKETLHQQGEITQRLYFIRSGALAIQVTHENRQYTTDLLGATAITPNVVDFYFQQPLPYSIQALCDSILYVIHLENIHRLLSYYAELKAALPEFLKSLQPNTVERSILLQWSNKEKFKYFLNKHPELLKLVPHFHIAAYLDMTAESFSRLLHRYKP